MNERQTTAMGGTGVAPETGIRLEIAPIFSIRWQSTSTGEIRRDAEFYGRDARATRFQR
jgi:hypothetical protein